MVSSASRLRWLIVVLCMIAGPAVAAADDAPKIPTREEVKAILDREPLTKQSWPVWRGRLLSWIGDRTKQTDAAYEAVREFLAAQADAEGALPTWLADDAFAWYGLGSAHLHAGSGEGVKRAEAAFRKSLLLDPSFARAHRHLAISLVMRAMMNGQPKAAAGPDERLDEARRELDQAVALDPALPLDLEFGLLAWGKHDFVESERRFRAAMALDPTDVTAAQWVARSISAKQSANQSGWGDAVKPLVDRFPDDGELRAHYAVALARDGNFLAAHDEIGRARSRGAEPNELFGPTFSSQILRGAWPYLAGRYSLWGAGVYLAAMVLMAGCGLLLARSTRGTRALRLLGDSQTEFGPTEFVASGQVIRSGGESILGRLYMTALMAGLIFFYVSIPFLALGTLVMTGGLLYLIFMLPRIPIKLIVIVVVVGLGAAWAILKSIFARPGKGSFGLAKTPEECPKLHATVRGVADRVETSPVDEIYLAPGSEIGVHQEGRGPFGVFGVKRRVLTLGISTMRYLTVSELKAILAHEYAHFSHKDTFYSRFIHQVTLSIEQALTGMGQAGGKLNYVNPVFWALLWYYRAYSLLAAGFSRSREFLADRMAASIYGKDAFIQGLKKVATEGTWFDKTIFQTTHGLLAENKALVNMYETFSSYRDDEAASKSRGEVHDEVMGQKSSLFASHPTLVERFEAVAPFPDVAQQETEPAMSLFEEPAKIEQELTEFYTSFVAYIRQLQNQAGAA